MAMSYIKKAKNRNKIFVMRGGITKTIEEGFALVNYKSSKIEK